MPHQTEPNVNNALGNLLQKMLPRGKALSENTRVISGHPGLKPDILITAPGRSPVVIEAEYLPAATVEPEAKERLGLTAASNGRVIEAVIALRYPEALKEVYDLQAALKDARLSYCVFTEDGGQSRFPESGWLEGSVEDLADMVRLVSVPQRAVDLAATILQKGIDGAAKHLDQVSETRPAIAADIARLLGMTNVPQTRRMACAIMANALVFHERIAGMHPNVRSLALVCGDDVAQPSGRKRWPHGTAHSDYQLFCHLRHRQEISWSGCHSGRWGQSSCRQLEGHSPVSQSRNRCRQRPRPDGTHLSSGSLPTGSTWPPSTPSQRRRRYWRGLL